MFSSIYISYVGMKMEELIKEPVVCLSPKESSI